MAFALLLDKIHFGNLITPVKDAFTQKYEHCTIHDHAYLTTYIVSYHAEAHQLNQVLLNSLNSSQQTQHYATDYEKNQVLQDYATSCLFSRVTNLPNVITITIGAKVMYLTNTLLSQGICNSSCGVITDIGPTGYPTVVFLTSDGIKILFSFSFSFFLFSLSSVFFPISSS